jgi:hypothetical protein
MILKYDDKSNICRQWRQFLSSMILKDNDKSNICRQWRRFLSSMMPTFVVKEDTLSIEKSREIYVSYIKFF